MTRVSAQNLSRRHTSASSLLSPSLTATVMRGLTDSVKTLPAVLFYDSAGAMLFEQICDQPEYYPTRTEIDILSRYASDLARQAGDHVALIEYGSGAGVKVRYLLDKLRDPVAYIPVDVSREQLASVARERGGQYPGLRIAPVCADYTLPFELPVLPNEARRVAFFPGSTIGNFHPTEAAAFLHRIRHTVGAKGGLILGVDRRKDPRVLHEAYNDRAGVTAAFNLNMLAHLNHAMSANFDLTTFRHVAFFNNEASRIEMHLESLVEQEVLVNDTRVYFEAGETVHTECSYKYDEQTLHALVESSGFAIDSLYSDVNDWFYLAWLRPA